MQTILTEFCPVSSCYHKPCHYFKLFHAEKKSGVVLWLLVMLLDKKYKNGGESLSASVLGGEVSLLL